MKIFAFILTLGAFILMGCSQPKGVETVAITSFAPEDLTNVQLIDVRTEKEYREGHLPGAENLDFFREDFATLFETFDKKKPVYLYCKGGNRSIKASGILDSLGFQRVVNLDGGFNAWRDAGKPVSK